MFRCVICSAAKSISVLLFLAASLSFAEEEFGRPLLKPVFDSAASTVACCLPGDSQSCIRRLIRGSGPNALDGACAGFSIVDSRIFADLNPMAHNPSCDSKNALGMHTRDYVTSGWIQNSHPTQFTNPPKRYAAENLAIMTPACDKLWDDDGGRHDYPMWKSARDRCAKTKGHYEAVRVYVNFLDADDINAQFALNAAISDPWINGHSRNVIYIHAQDLLELRREILRLVMSNCYVIEHIMFASHGAIDQRSVGGLVFPVPGTTGGVVGVPNGKNKDIVSVLQTAMPPCVLSPAAKIQFTTCIAACGDNAAKIKRDLNDLFHVKNSFKTKSNVDALKNVQVMLNTGYGGGGSHMMGDLGRFSFRSTNELGIVYKIGEDAVSSDIPTGGMPNCRGLTARDFF